MGGKRSRAGQTTDSTRGDDLSSIKGIGRITQARLYEAGIRTYKQLAALSPAKLGTRISGLSTRQIERQNWIGQARKLASKHADSRLARKMPARLPARQHYENFTVELLFDEKNQARRTRMIHIQSRAQDEWAGWNPKQLIEFLIEHSKLRVSQPDLAMQAAERVHPNVLPSQHRESEPAPIDTATCLRGSTDISPLAQSDDRLDTPAPPSCEFIRLTGTLRLLELKVISIDSDMPIAVLHQGQPYILQLTLDLSNVAGPRDLPLVYQAALIIKQLGGPYQPVSEASSIIRLSDRATLAIIGTGLPPGLYRVDAFVRLTVGTLVPGLAALLKGEILQVH